MEHSYTPASFYLRGSTDRMLYSIIPSTAASFFGHIFQIFIMYQNKNMRTTPNLFTLNMAIANILFSASQLHFAIHPPSAETFIFLVFTLEAAPMESLVAIALHTFYAVVFPMKARLESRKTCALAICSIWLFALALSSPVLFHINSYTRYIYGFIYVIIIIILPCITMTFLNSIIVVKLWQQKIPGHPSSAIVRSRRERNIKLTKRFITVWALFCLTHGSASIIYFTYGKTTTWTNVVVTVLHSLYPALNPYICFIYCEQFRKGFKDIFICHVQRYNVEVALDANVKAMSQGRTISSQKEPNVQSWQTAM